MSGFQAVYIDNVWGETDRYGKSVNIVWTLILPTFSVWAVAVAHSLQRKLRYFKTLVTIIVTNVTCEICLLTCAISHVELKFWHVRKCHMWSIHFHMSFTYTDMVWFDMIWHVVHNSHMWHTNMIHIDLVFNISEDIISLINLLWNRRETKILPLELAWESSHFCFLQCQSNPLISLFGCLNFVWGGPTESDFEPPASWVESSSALCHSHWLYDVYPNSKRSV